MEGCRRRSSGAVQAMAVAMVAAFMVASLADVSEAAISCSTVRNYLTPCAAYLITTGARPSGACCNGVRGLYSVTRGSRPDRMMACGCIKSLAASFSSQLKQANVRALPGTCGVNLGYTISPSINCNSIP